MLGEAFTGTIGLFMKIDLKEMTEHDMGDDCPVCRTQAMVDMALLPATAAWEQQNQLPAMGLALHGAAGLLAAMLQEGVPRATLEQALGKLLDEYEQDAAMGGPPQGHA
jgi:hypothetical protein